MVVVAILKLITMSIDQITNFFEVLERVKPIDMLIHCGDLEELDDYISGFVTCPVEMVRGNCDFCSPLPGETTICAKNHRIFVTHGHMYGVKMGLQHLADRAKTLGADIALYGHTHMPILTEIDGVTILNPGSLSEPRQYGRKPSFAVIEIDDRGEAHFTIKYLGKD